MTSFSYFAADMSTSSTGSIILFFPIFTTNFFSHCKCTIWQKPIIRTTEIAKWTKWESESEHLVNKPLWWQAFWGRGNWEMVFNDLCTGSEMGICWQTIVEIKEEILIAIACWLILLCRPRNAKVRRGCAVYGYGPLYIELPSKSTPANQ